MAKITNQQNAFILNRIWEKRRENLPNIIKVGFDEKTQNKNIISNYQQTFDEVIPDRWISRENKEFKTKRIAGLDAGKIEYGLKANKWMVNLNIVSKNEESFLKIFYNAAKSGRINADGTTKLSYNDRQTIEELKSQTARINEQFSKCIYFGIKKDIDKIAKIEKYKENNIITKSIKENLIKTIKQDITNFCGIENQELKNNIDELKFYQNQLNIKINTIKEIGFWKGNFFGTKDEMQKYDAAKITRPITQEKINNVNHRFRDAVIKNSNLSVLDNDYGKYNNFENKKFRDNAIAHANIEQEILNNASKIEFNNSLIGDDFFKEQSNVEKTIKEIYENKELNRNYLAGKLNSEDEKKIEKEQLVSEASKLKKNKTLNIPRSNSNASQILDIKNEPQKSSEKNISQSAPEPQNGYVPMGVII